MPGLAIDEATRERIRALRAEGLTAAEVAAAVEAETGRQISTKSVMRFARSNGRRRGDLASAVLLEAMKEARSRGRIRGVSVAELLPLYGGRLALFGAGQGDAEGLQQPRFRLLRAADEGLKAHKAGEAECVAEVIIHYTTRGEEAEPALARHLSARGYLDTDFTFHARRPK